MPALQRSCGHTFLVGWLVVLCMYHGALVISHTVPFLHIFFMMYRTAVALSEAVLAQPQIILGVDHIDRAAKTSRFTEKALMIHN